MTVTNGILTSLEPLFEQAHSENLWFYSQSMAGIFWFSPDELEKAQSEGRFIGGPVNWELRDPTEREKGLQHRIQEATKELEEFQQRMLASR